MYNFFLQSCLLRLINTEYPLDSQFYDYLETLVKLAYQVQI